MATTDADIFDGRVEILTDDLLSHRADATRLRLFYEMAPLDWDIIASRGDICRDQENDLLKEVVETSGSLRLVCIRGEPGSGKSTLAWRVAAELHTGRHGIVLRVKDREDPEPWYRMAEFCGSIGRQVYVLADDLFRNTDVRMALRELNPWLPLTILATSQTNEYRRVRFKGELVTVDLAPPSVDEKERILDRLGLDADKLDHDQQIRLRSANEFLVLMAELTSGKGFEKIVLDSLDNLYRLHEAIYHAYEYLCFCYSYEISIPSPVLERLDEAGRFRDLPNREGALGLVFFDTAEPGMVRSGHPKRANAARSLYEEKRPAAAVLLELVNSVDSTNFVERRFVARLIRRLSTARPGVVEAAFPQIEDKLETVALTGNIHELGTWQGIYTALHRPSEAERCVATALERTPSLSVDCNMLVHLLRQQGREPEALPVLKMAIGGNPGLGHAYPAYLGLMERYGKREELSGAINEVRDWLATAENNGHVMGAYIGFVERLGSAEQVREVIIETDQWLDQHEVDTRVRIAFLGLVESKGSRDEIEAAIRKTSNWLNTHKQDHQVRTAYLGLVERQGTPEQVENVVAEIGEWLQENLQDRNVRTAYLGLVERQGTPEQVANVVAETGEWLQENLQDRNVRTAYLGLVERQGSPERIKVVVESTVAWIRTHPRATDVMARLLSMLSNLGRAEEARKLVEEAVLLHSNDRNLVTHYLDLMSDRLDDSEVRRLYSTLLESFPRDALVKQDWARWLHRRGYLDEADIEFQALVASYPRNHRYRYAYGRLLLDREQFREAASEFRRVIARHDRHAMAHDGLALSMQGLARRAAQDAYNSRAERYFAMAELEFMRAIKSAVTKDDGVAVFYTHLGWLYIDNEKWPEAVRAFDMAIDENPEYFGNYWGRGQAALGLRDWQIAQVSLLTALEKAPGLGPPASRDIEMLLDECRTALADGQLSAK